MCLECNWKTQTNNENDDDVKRNDGGGSRWWCRGHHLGMTWDKESWDNSRKSTEGYNRNTLWVILNSKFKNTDVRCQGVHFGKNNCVVESIKSHTKSDHHEGQALCNLCSLFDRFGRYVIVTTKAYLLIWYSEDIFSVCVAFFHLTVCLIHCYFHRGAFIFSKLRLRLTTSTKLEHLFPRLLRLSFTQLRHPWWFTEVSR